MAGSPALFHPSRGERAIEDRDAPFLNGVALATPESREEEKVRPHVHLPDRGALADASELIDRYGAFAAPEARLRADRSRDVGNFVHFCRWRQIERMIDILADPSVTGPVH